MRKLIYHGLTGTRVYQSWYGMIGRCYNPKNGKFYMYGKRGIRVCEFLRATPHNLKSILGERPKGKSIDRIDNSGGYWCGVCAECFSNNHGMNIRWATAKQQARNFRRNFNITINGTTLCQLDWAARIGITRESLRDRINSGISGEKLLHPPVRTRTRLANGTFARAIPE